MRKLRIMMLVHTSLVPPEDLVDEDDPRMEEYQTEFDVKSTLLDLGHSVKVVGVYDNLAPIRQTIEGWTAYRV
jgi:D-alanine-D-alanine ligase